MRLTEIKIDKYGPLQDRIYKLSKGFNLLMGNNEHGKTLTIDALVKLLLAKQKGVTKNFDQIDRVNENPEGYAELLKGGVSFKITEKKGLTELVEMTPLEWSNIFIIRNSDLSIPNEESFYTHITDRLTGLRTIEINKITAKLNEGARLTSKGKQFENNEKNSYLGKRLDKAAILIAELNELQAHAKEQGYDCLEVKLAELKEEKSWAARELANLDEANKRENYEKVAAAWHALINTTDDWAKLKPFNDDDRDLWRDCEKEVISLTKEIEDKVSVLEKQSNKLQEVMRTLEEREKKLQAEEQCNSHIDNLHVDINECLRQSADIKQREEKKRWLAPLAYISSVLLAVSLAGSAINPSPWSILLTGLFFISFAALWWPHVILSRHRGNFAKLLEKLNLSLAPYGMQADDLSGILGRIKDFEKKYEDIKRDVNILTYRKINLEDKLQELQGNVILQFHKERGEAEKEIEKIKRRSGVESFQEYKDKLSEKQELEKTIGNQRSILKSITGDRISQNPEGDLKYWEQKVKDLEIHKHKAPGITYNEQRESELKVSINELEHALNNFGDALNTFKEQLYDLERSVNEILLPEKEYEFLPCRNYLDLEFVREKLQQFVNKCEYKKDGANLAVEIFEEINKEEKEKVGELFGERSVVSNYMNQITEGLYPCVLFDGSAVLCRLKNEDSSLELKAEKLSGGAYDQLYFSIRLALGERLLKGEKGFFILDDPFIKADYNRLRHQLEILKGIVAMGWQIIYFSAKKEVKDILAEEVNSGTVSFQEIPKLR